LFSDDSDWRFSDDFGELGMHLDVPYVPTDERVVQKLLKLGAVDSSDLLFDLGSGDGRIVVQAALEFGARGVGVEMDPGRVAEASAYAAQMGVDDRVEFFEEDLFLTDFSRATVVTLYLLHSANLDLRPRLLGELRPGARVLSHAFDMGEWRPDQRINHSGINLYMWVIPARVGGSWYWQGSDGQEFLVELEQTYQRIRGRAWINGQDAGLRAVLWGDLLELIFHPESLEPLSIIMHCRGDELMVLKGDRRGIVAGRVAPAETGS